jgi:predicted secreted protein
MLELSDTDDGRAVSLAVGESAALTLPDLATAGYCWEVRTSGGVEVVGEQRLPPGPGAPGAGGVRRFVVAAHADGAVVATLARAWEPAPIRVVTVAVRVTERS